MFQACENDEALVRHLGEKLMGWFKSLFQESKGTVKSEAKTPLKCPACGLTNPPEAMRCDCGFYFKKVTVTKTLRQGKCVPVDDVFNAWTSGDLDEMLKAVNTKTNPIDRHFLLQSIVSETYKLRKNKKYRKLCIEHSEKHLKEFGGIAPALKEDIGFLPRIATFQHYATVLTEDGEFEKAIAICKQAMQYGLHDGTKSGYAGRIERIKKQASKARLKKDFLVEHKSLKAETVFHLHKVEYKSLKAEEVRDSSSSRVLYQTPQGHVLAEQFARQYYSSQKYDSIWSENHFWWQVMALLFWDIIFARVKGAVVATRLDGEDYFPEPGDKDFENQFSTFINMNGMPHDFFLIEFYQRRRSIIDNRFKELESSNLIEELLTSYHQHNGQNCRAIEDWNTYPLDNLIGPLEFIPNSVILGICRKLLSYFGGNRAGLPDLIVYKQGDFLFSEVKSKNDKLSQEQREWHDYLSTELGQKVEILLINYTDRQIENLKKAATPKE